MIKAFLHTALFLSVLGSVPEIWAQAGSGARIALQKSTQNGPLSLTLGETVALALEHNPTLMVEKIRIEQARGKIGEEKGTFDTLLNLRGSIARRDNIIASRFYPTGFYFDSEQAPSISVEGRTYSGARFSVGLDYRRLVSTSNTQTLSPQYSANLNFSFTQPLLRDFGWGVNQTKIRVAEKGSEIAENTVFQRVSQLIQSVEEMYWGLVFLHENLEAKKRNLEVAQGLLNQSQDLLRAGIVAPVSVLEARSGAAAREDDLITADGELNRFEDRLKVALWLDLSMAGITPMDRPLEQLVSFNEVEILETALSRRPEIQALKREIEQRQIELKYASNQTKPRLDLGGQYGLAGISGRPNPTCIDPTSVFCEPVGSSIGGSVFAGLTQPGDALARLISRRRFDNWTAEIKMQIPLGNRTAEARKSEANLQLLDTETRLQALRDQIAMEVRDSIRETRTARKHMEAARETIRFIDDQLEGTRKRFEAGLASTYDVLQVLGELDKARTGERKAIMDYNIGQSKIRLAEASNLPKYNVELKKPPRYVFDANNLVQ